MAYFDRVVDTSSNSRDVRGWKYAVYKCEVCGEESEFTLVPNFQFRERPCKHCGALGKEDKIHSLKKEREGILKQVTDLNTKLLDVETQISELESENELTKILNFK